jgi:hypothetical protein
MSWCGIQSAGQARLAHIWQLLAVLLGPAERYAHRSPYTFAIFTLAPPQPQLWPSLQTAFVVFTNSFFFISTILSEFPIVLLPRSAGLPPRSRQSSSLATDPDVERPKPAAKRVRMMMMMMKMMMKMMMTAGMRRTTTSGAKMLTKEG